MLSLGSDDECATAATATKAHENHEPPANLPPPQSSQSPSPCTVNANVVSSGGEGGLILKPQDLSDLSCKDLTQDSVTESSLR